MEEITRQDCLKGLQEEIKNIKDLKSKCIKEDLPLDGFEGFRDPLSIEKEIVVKILLSWGGGSDGYKLTFSSDKELLRGVYFKADWGTYNEVELNEEELNLIYETYLYSEFPEDLK